MPHDQAVAIEHVNEALTAAPYGSHGAVRRVRPSHSGTIEYDELGTVAEASQTTEGVTWSK